MNNQNIEEEIEATEKKLQELYAKKNTQSASPGLFLAKYGYNVNDIGVWSKIVDSDGNLSCVESDGHTLSITYYDLHDSTHKVELCGIDDLQKLESILSNLPKPRKFKATQKQSAIFYSIETNPDYDGYWDEDEFTVEEVKI